jgi:hypothetical protein
MAYATQVDSQVFQDIAKLIETHDAFLVTAAGDLDVPNGWLPGRLSMDHPRVLSVGGWDPKTTSEKNETWIWTGTQGLSQIGKTVSFFAPASDWGVIEPRGGKTKVSSTALSAGFVAGLLARLGPWNTGGSDEGLSRLLEHCQGEQKLAKLSKYGCAFGR